MKKMHKIDKHTGARSSWAAVALAVGALAPIEKGFAQVAPTYLATSPEGGWQYSASIYAYLPSVGGSSSFPADSGGTSLNLSNHILDGLKLFGMGTFGAHNGTWGMFADVVYMNFAGSQSGSRDFTIGNVGLPAGASATFDWDLKGCLNKQADGWLAVVKPGELVKLNGLVIQPAGTTTLKVKMTTADGAAKGALTTDASVVKIGFDAVPVLGVILACDPPSARAGRRPGEGA